MDFVGSTSAILRLRWRLSGTDNSTANSYIYQYILGNAAAGISAGVTGDFGALTDIKDAANIVTVDIYGVALARITNAVSTEYGLGTGTDFVGNYGNYHNQTTAYDGFTIYPSTGTITGTLRVYGYKN